MLDRLLARPVDGREVDYDVLGFEHQVAQDGVDSRGGVGHERQRVNGYGEELGHGGARDVEETWEVVADERVRTCFVGILERAEGGEDGARVRAEGACDAVSFDGSHVFVLLCEVIYVGEICVGSVDRSCMRAESV